MIPYQFRRAVEAVVRALGSVLKTSGMATTTEVTATVNYQDHITTTQTVSAGTLLVVASVYFQAQAFTSITDFYAKLVVDGDDKQEVHTTCQAQWDTGTLVLTWIGAIAAGSKTWTVQIKENVANATIVAKGGGKMAWALFL